MIGQSLRMAVKSIAGNKMRSFLTILGIIIGVIAIVVLVAIGQGANTSVSSSIESLGTNLLSVSIDTQRKSPVTAADLDALLLENDSIADIAPALTQTATAKAGTNTYEEGTVIGTGPGFDAVRNLTVSSGRFLKQPDLFNRSFVAVLGVEAADGLYGTRDAVGRSFRMNGYDFTVVGVLGEQGSSYAGSNDNRIIIPFTLAERIFASPGIRNFFVSASSPDAVNLAEAAVTNYLGTKFDDDALYTVYNQTDLLATLDEALGTLTMMLGGIAAISLLVGGIGIMNIMLVSVSERTREIGIRKAVGAKRRDILTQFLIEALVVSVLGGLLGLLISYFILQFLSPILEMQLVISAGVAELALGFSMVIGVVFGLYPANKASKLHPIEALRYDG